MEEGGRPRGAGPVRFRAGHVTRWRAGRVGSAFMFIALIMPGLLCSHLLTPASITAHFGFLSVYAVIIYRFPFHTMQSCALLISLRDIQHCTLEWNNDPERSSAARPATPNRDETPISFPCDRTTAPVDVIRFSSSRICNRIDSMTSPNRFILHTCMSWQCLCELQYPGSP